ncbi:MAG: alkaline phosphatase PhoX [Cyanobacteria bacterium P01_H01_bin.121]
MKLKRRQFLQFMGATAGAVATGSIGNNYSQGSYSQDNHSRTLLQPAPAAAAGHTDLKFQPVRIPIPLDSDGLPSREQQQAFSRYEVIDDIVVPEGYTYDLIAAWGDPLGDSRFGYNNDYVSFVEISPNQGFITVNFEYISGDTWQQTYPIVVGKPLPFAKVKAAAEQAGGSINAFALADTDPLKAEIKAIAKEALSDMGVGVLSVRRTAAGGWQRTNSPQDRRISGISGLEDGRYLQATGPATAVFTKPDKLGYDDGLGNKIIGTFQNCAGGTTPWGTALSAEENFQGQVPEAVMADGSSLNPGERTFTIDDDMRGQANVFGYAGNKYGWMVEVDPSNAKDFGTKHTWLGRFRHEAVAFNAQSGKRLAVYSGCDRRSGHLYKFVSEGIVRDVQAKSNSQLFANGMLYGAKFNPDGTGQWIALNPETPVDPILPSQVHGRGGQGMVTLPNPDRAKGGYVKVTSDAEAMALKQQFQTLGDLYIGASAAEKQGAILIDAHFAANAAGITATARPEDTDVDPRTGTLYVAFTSGGPGGDGGPDRAIFSGPNGEPYEYGWIVKIDETGNDPAAMTFNWDILALGGEPVDGGFGFANPDNLDIDAQGNVWMVTDMSTSSHNRAVPSRVDEDGKPVSLSGLRGLFGNNSTWLIKTTGPHAGEAYPFALGPMESEICGVYMTPDQKTLFLAPQHPGEKNGMRQGMASEQRSFAMKTTTGDLFMQDRTVPVGSNWPGKGPNDPPKPALVAVRRLDGGTLI